MNLTLISRFWDISLFTPHIPQQCRCMLNTLLVISPSRMRIGLVIGLTASCVSLLITPISQTWLETKSVDFAFFTCLSRSTSPSSSTLLWILPLQYFFQIVSNMCQKYGWNFSTRFIVNVEHTHTHRFPNVCFDKSNYPLKGIVRYLTWKFYFNLWPLMHGL